MKLKEYLTYRNLLIFETFLSLIMAFLLISFNATGFITAENVIKNTKNGFGVFVFLAVIGLSGIVYTRKHTKKKKY